MSITTSSFKISGSLPNAVAIVQYLPKWPRPWRGLHYPALAPTHKMFGMDNEKFDRAFNALLAGLDPQRTHEELVQLGGPDAILICYEPPGFGCHRRMVAEWLEITLGIVVEEIGFPRSETPAYADSPDVPKQKRRKKPGNLTLFGLDIPFF